MNCSSCRISVREFVKKCVRPAVRRSIAPSGTFIWSIWKSTTLYMTERVLRSLKKAWFGRASASWTVKKAVIKTSSCLCLKSKMLPKYIVRCAIAYGGFCISIKGYVSPRCVVRDARCPINCISKSVVGTNMAVSGSERCGVRVGLPWI